MADYSMTFNDLIEISLPILNCYNTDAVTCDQMGNVVGLRLAGRYLGGGIPAEIAEFTELAYLDISNNKFTRIAPEFAQLQKLTYLNIAGNAFTGPIPEPIARLTSLKTLYAYDNQFTGEMPGWIYMDLPNLHYLDVSNNLLTGRIDKYGGQYDAITGRVDEHGIQGEVNLSRNCFQVVWSGGPMRKWFGTQGNCPATCAGLGETQSSEFCGDWDQVAHEDSCFYTLIDEKSYDSCDVPTIVVERSLPSRRGANLIARM
ncbi:hypothetical protein HDU98_011839 [Podochytrium sp. JEL0797]|nr:hypothetical protein HDU98_011839 [Podochytrium sp. JEL0797]